jgi:hypothetical protein
MYIRPVIQSTAWSTFAWYYWLLTLFFSSEPVMLLLPGSALQGLLRKLGAGFEDMLPGMGGVSGARMKVSGILGALISKHE